MTTHTNRPDDQEMVKYPPDYRMTVGAAEVFIALTCKVDQPTKNGKRTVLHVIPRQDQDHTFTLWWKKLPLPPLHTPFLLRRVSEMEYTLVTPDSDAQMKELWTTGALGSEGARQIAVTGAADEKAKAIIARFK